MIDGLLGAEDFMIGERLHLTIAQVQALPNNEFHQWRAYFTWKASLREKAEREAAVKSKLKGRRGR